MKKQIFLLIFSLSVIGLSLNAQNINVDSVRIDSVKYSGVPNSWYVYTHVYGMLSLGLPANISVEKGVCPSYNDLGSTNPVAITTTGNSSRVIAVTGLPSDTCIMVRALIGGGNSFAVSNIVSFTNIPTHPCSFVPEIISGAGSVCQGDSILLIATPAGAVYQWKRNGILLSTSQMCYAKNSGMYSVAITLGNCTDSVFKNIGVLPAPVIDTCIASGSTLIINGHFNLPVVVKVNSTTYTPIYSDSLQIILNGVAGVNTGDVVSVEYPSGCASEMVLIFTGIEEITMPGSKEDARIFNIQGQEVKKPLGHGFYIQGRKKFVVTTAGY